MGYSWGLGMLQSFLGSTHIAEQLLISMLPTILALNFGVFFGCFRLQWAFFGFGVRFKNLLPNLGVVLAFWGPVGYLWVLG